MSAVLKLVTSGRIRIEKNVPMRRRCNNAILYPFDQMECGDSFMVPTTDSETPRKVDKFIRRQMELFAKQYGSAYQFTIRKVAGGMRCWRIK
jgi:hypothetical protein